MEDKEQADINIAFQYKCGLGEDTWSAIQQRMIRFSYRE